MSAQDARGPTIMIGQGYASVQPGGSSLCPALKSDAFACRSATQAGQAMLRPGPTRRGPSLLHALATLRTTGKGMSLRIPVQHEKFDAFGWDLGSSLLSAQFAIRTPNAVARPAVRARAGQRPSSGAAEERLVRA